MVKVAYLVFGVILILASSVLYNFYNLEYKNNQKEVYSCYLGNLNNPLPVYEENNISQMPNSVNSSCEKVASSYVSGKSNLPLIFGGCTLLMILGIVSIIVGAKSSKHKPKKR